MPTTRLMSPKANPGWEAPGLLEVELPVERYPTNMPAGGRTQTVQVGWRSGNERLLR